MSAASTRSSFLEPQIAPAEGPDVSERMVIITGPPEAQFKVSAKDHVRPAGSGSRAGSSEELKFWGILISISPAAFGCHTLAWFLISLCSAFSSQKGGWSDSLHSVGRLQPLQL